jgi:hypothetical protein
MVASLVAFSGFRLLGSDPHFVTWQSLPSPVQLSSLTLTLAGLLLLLAAAIVAADIVIGDLRVAPRPSIMQGKLWRVTVTSIWLTGLVLFFVWIFADVWFEPASPR